MAAVFTEAQRANLHALSEGAIDEQWISGVRAGWKKLAKQTQKFKGRRSKAPKIDFQYIHDASDSAEAALQNVKRYIGQLRDDLLLNKGFWDLPSDAPGKKEVSMVRRYKTKVIDELDAADEAIDDGIMRVRGAKTDTEEVDRFGNTGYWRKRLQDDKEKFDWYLNSVGVHVDDAIAEVDKAISVRLLRHLSKMVAGSYTYKPQDGKLVKQTVPIDWGEYEPEVVHLGKATVVFQDMPRIGSETHGVMSPRKVGSETTVSRKGEIVTTKEVTSRTKHGGGFMHPKHRKDFLAGLKQAERHLQAKQLGKLFGGTFKIEPKERAGTNQYGAHLGVGGRYYRKGDEIHIYGATQPDRVAVVAIHEIGHRYYYKHMTSQDRHNFDKWFGDVPAVSEYGGINPAEDFAEVFTHYVLGRGMTKDQMQRFRQFMTGKRPRTEALEEGMATKAQKCTFCDQAAVMSLIWAEGASYVPVCEAHYAEGRNKISLRGGSVCDVKNVEQGPVTYREHQFNPRARMQAALEPALAFVEEAEAGTYFGLQASPERLSSAFAEAPADPPPSAPIGRRDIPRGAVIATRTGDDIQGMTGQPIKRTSGKSTRAKQHVTRHVMKRDRTRQEIPDSLMQMLGTDWKTMRAQRVHDNRMTVTIDGVRYSVYTRRG